jgi:hypothetical protein
LIIEPVYRKYRKYNYVDNFRAEVVLLHWQFLNASVIALLVSGAVLTGLRGKSPLNGFYGLAFSSKLALWLLQLYLSQQFLRPFTPEVPAFSRDPEGSSGQTTPAWVLVALLFLIFFSGFVLKYL